MNHVVYSFIVFSFVCSICAGKDISVDDPGFGKVLRNGAEAKCTLRVVDDLGVPVEGAGVKVSYMMEKSKWIRGKTDTNGMFTATGKSRGEMRYGAIKDGYYRTSHKVEYDFNKVPLVSDGKWQPWNPTLEVILKKIKNPIPMYAKRLELEIPSTNRLFGFDFEQGDWIKPYGSGKTASLWVNLYETSGDDGWKWHKKLTLSFGTNVFDGVKVIANDDFSVYKAPYEAFMNGYDKSIDWEYKRTPAC